MENKDMKQQAKKPAPASFAQKFQAYYKKNILPKLESIEKERQKYQLISNGILMGSIFLGIVLLLLFSSFSANKISINFTPIFVAVAVGFAGMKLTSKIFSEKVKTQILPKILSFIGEFEINNNKLELLNGYVDDLHLFNPFNTYVYDDRLKGKYKGLDINIEEITLEKNSSQTLRIKGSQAISAKDKLIFKLIESIISLLSKRGVATEAGNKVFSGLFIRVPSLKKYKGRTIVKAEKTPHKIKDEAKVNLEDPEFEKLYDTFSTDQIEARYLLTTAFMNRMVTLANKGIGKRIFVSFEKSYVNIAVALDKDWLEIPDNTPITNIENYKTLVGELSSVLKIIDTLKLEQNIGL